jgi:hypothetical protein
MILSQSKTRVEEKGNEKGMRGVEPLPAPTNCPIGYILRLCTIHHIRFNPHELSFLITAPFWQCFFMLTPAGFPANARIFVHNFIQHSYQGKKAKTKKPNHERFIRMLGIEPGLP